MNLIRVTFRYAISNGFSIEGTEPGLFSFAAVLKERATLAERRLITVGGLDNYDEVITRLVVRHDDGLVRLERSEERLVITGRIDLLSIMAENVEWIASASPGEHLHIDYHPGHHYLRDDSEPVVLTRI